MKKYILKFLPVCLLLALLSYGCARQTGSTRTTATEAGENQAGNVYAGKIIGKSNKAKTISIEVGKGSEAKTILVKFDDRTKGVVHAAKDNAAIISYEMRDGDPWATVVKPKLAKLPKGVTEIKTDELKALLKDEEDLLLIDARPAKRYAEAHMPGAVNLSVPDYGKNAASVLPADKDTLLIFYCGGPT